MDRRNICSIDLVRGDSGQQYFEAKIQIDNEVANIETVCDNEMTSDNLKHCLDFFMKYVELRELLND